MARYCILLSRLCIEGESKVLVRCTIALPHVTGRGAPLQGSFARRGRRDLFAGPVFVCDAWTRATPKRGTYCPASASNCGPRPTKTRSYRPASASCRGLCRQGPVSARRPRLPASAHQPLAASPRGGAVPPGVCFHPRPASPGVCFPPWAAPYGLCFHPQLTSPGVCFPSWVASPGVCPSFLIVFQR